MTEGRAGRCPDGGYCHGSTLAAGSTPCPEGACYRVTTSGPLSGVYPGDRWPAEVVTAHARRAVAEPEPPAPTQFVVVGEWLAVDVGRHTCGTGIDGHYGAHEPGCGLEPVERVEVLLAVLRPDEEAVVEELARLRHEAIPRVPGEHAWAEEDPGYKRAGRRYAALDLAQVREAERLARSRP